MNKATSLISPCIEDSDPTTKKETIPPYLPGDCELTKETLEDGSIVIRHAHNKLNEMETYDIDLYSMIHCWFCRLKDLVNLLDDDCSSFQYIFESVMQATELELSELNDFIKKTIGFIRVERINGHNSLYRNDRIVMVRVE